MLLYFKVETISKKMINRLVEKMCKHMNDNNIEFDGYSWRIDYTQVEIEFPVSFFYRFFHLFDTSGFYKKVLFRLYSQGRLERDKENDNLYYFTPSKNKDLFDLFPNGDK